MSYIGSKPTAVPLTGADIEDGTIQIADLSATGTKDATTFLRGDGTFASAGGTNTPAFYAYLSGSQSITSGTVTKIQFNTEVVDTASAFDNATNYRWTCPAGEGGKYFFFTSMKAKSASNNISYAFLSIKKNGSDYEGAENNFAGNTGVVRGNFISFSFIDNVTAGDYYEGYAQIVATSPTVEGIEFGFQKQTRFGGYKIIE